MCKNIFTRDNTSCGLFSEAPLLSKDYIECAVDIFCPGNVMPMLITSSEVRLTFPKSIKMVIEKESLVSKRKFYREILMQNNA